LPELRVITPEGETQLMSRDEALKKAEEYGLDLVEVAPNVRPPVCKIIDYGKFRYELERKMKEAKKHQKNIVVKEIRMRPQIGENDYKIKLEHIKKFISQKNKVKVNIFFKGRELSHSELGMDLAKRLKEDLSGIAALENNPKLEGKTIVLQFVQDTTKKT